MLLSILLNILRIILLSSVEHAWYSSGYWSVYWIQASDHTHSPTVHYTHTHTPHPPPPESTVKSLMPYWYRPNITREEAIDFVRQLESGSFIVRDSQTVSAEIRTTCSA